MDRILVVEDELSLTEAIKFHLNGAGYDVDVAHDGPTAIDKASNNDYNVIVLDIMLPGCDGFEVLRKMRGRDIKTPVIVVSALGDIDSRLRGFEAGADGYLPKPFSPRELIARIRAITRRARGSEKRRAIEALGDLTLNDEERTLSCGDKTINLSKTEVMVLEAFAKEPNTVQTRDHLLSVVWGDKNDVQPNIIEAYVSFLRQKLEFVGSRVSIRTVRNVGYVLDTVGREEPDEDN